MCAPARNFSILEALPNNIAADFAADNTGTIDFVLHTKCAKD